MKLCLLALFISMEVFAASASYAPSGAAYDLNRIGPAARKWNLGTLIRQENTAIATYDFTKDGGAVGTVTFPLKLPSGAIVKRVFFDNVTSASSLGAATIGFSLQSSGDLKATNTAYTSWTGRLAGIPDDTTTNMIKLTAQRTLTMSIGTAALTAGKIKAFIEYVIGE